MWKSVVFLCISSVTDVKDLDGTQGIMYCDPNLITATLQLYPSI